MSGVVLCLFFLCSLLGAQAPGNAQAVSVQVVDWQGRPVKGAQVAVGPAEKAYLPDRATTGAQGACTISVPKQNLRTRMVASVSAAVSERIEVPFDGLALPKGPIRIQLPKLGKVRVILYGPDEKPLADVQRVTLRVAAPSGTQQQLAHALPSKQDADGALFAFVELGAEVVASVTVRGLAATQEFRRTGPTRAGELIVLEARTNLGPSILEVRVLNVDGRPMPDQEIKLLWRRTDGRIQISHYTFASTDERARLRLEFDQASRWVYLFAHLDQDEYSYPGTAILSAEGRQPGLHDGGDVRLRAAPIVGRGRLVDDQGQPVTNALVEGRITQITKLSGGGMNGRWNPYLHRVRTDEQGRFELRELEPKAEAIELQVKGTDLIHPGGTLSLPLSGKEHAFALVRTSRVAGTFAEHLGDIHPKAHLIDPKTGQRHRLQVEGRAFRSDPIPPGVYDLRLGLVGAEVGPKTIRAPAGAASPDPRLRELDWSPWLRRSRIEVVDERGAPVPRALVICWRQTDDGPRSESYNTDASGVCTLLSYVQKCHVDVRLDGHLSRDGLVPEPEMHVVLERLAKLSIPVAGLPPLPRGVAASWRAFPAAEKKAPSANWKVGNLRKGRIELQPSAKGAWTLQMRFRFAERKDLPPDALRQIHAELRTDLPDWNFEVGNPAAPPTELQLDETTRNDLELRFETVRSILKKQVGGGH